MGSLKKLLGSRGFSLIQVLGASALMGAASVGMMKIVSSQGNSTKKLKQDLVINNFLINAQAILGRQSSCNRTFDNTSITVSLATNRVQSVSSIYHMTEDGNNTIRTITSSNDPATMTAAQALSTTIGEGVWLTRIELDNINQIQVNEADQANAVFTFKRRMAKGKYKIEKKNVPLFLELAANGRVSRCLSQLEEATENKIDDKITEALVTMCEALPGTFDRTTRECSVDFENNSNFQAAVEKYSKEKGVKSTCDAIGGTYSIVDNEPKCDVSGLGGGGEGEGNGDPKVEIGRHIYEITLLHRYDRGNPHTRRPASLSASASCRKVMAVAPGTSQCNSTGLTPLRTLYAGSYYANNRKYGLLVPSHYGTLYGGIYCPTGSSGKVTTTTRKSPTLAYPGSSITTGGYIYTIKCEPN